MAQMWFKIDGFWVNVSTHGYFTIYSRVVPPLKFSTCPCRVYDSSVVELEHGIRYTPNSDNINIDLQNPKLPTIITKFIKKRIRLLDATDDELIKKWNKTRKIKALTLNNGDKVHLGDHILLDGRLVKLLWFDIKDETIDYSSSDGSISSTGLNRSRITKPTTEQIAELKIKDEV